MSERSLPLAAAFTENHRTLMALARSVVGADDAPDAVQDAMLSALCQPSDVRHYGRWLGRVVRNQARQQARGGRRRLRREQAAHWTDTPASVEEAAARSEILDALHEGWQQLAPPYREALRLRFFEGLAYSEIGERLGCSTNTASWRVREGIIRLRRWLDTRFGDRRSWFGALAAATGWPSDAPTPVAQTGSTMKTIALIGGALLATGAAATVMTSDSDDTATAATTRDATGSVDVPSTDAPARPAAVASDSTPRTPQASTETAEPSPMLPDAVASPPTGYGVVVHPPPEGSLEPFGDYVAELSTLVREVYGDCVQSTGHDIHAQYRFRFSVPSGDIGHEDVPNGRRMAECLGEQLTPEEGAVPKGVSGDLVLVMRPLYPEDTDPKAIADDASATDRAAIALSGLPVRGTSPEAAKVTIVECSDFDCAYCRRIAPTIDRILDEYADSVVFAFAHDPLDFHATAELKARAAVAAERQGKFWEMYDALLVSKAATEAALVDLAVEIGLSPDEFRRDLAADTTREAVEAQKTMCQEHDARGVPTFFINGRRLDGARDFEVFRTIIDEELAAAR